jgi:hypothetical protein
MIVAQARWVFTLDASPSWTVQGNAMAGEIAKLPKSSRLAIVVDPPLPHPEDVPVCLSTSLSDYRRCAYPRVAPGAYVGSREALAARATGASLIDFTSSVCPGTGACPVVIDNVIVWRDDHHLTATFAATLGPALDAKLVAILNKPHGS